MRTYWILLAAVCAAFPVAGCSSYFDTGSYFDAGPAYDLETGEVIALPEQTDMKSVARSKAKATATDTASGPVDFSQVVHRSSEGSVEVYDASPSPYGEADLPYGKPQSLHKPFYSGDPSVEVFPFDGEMEQVLPSVPSSTIGYDRQGANNIPVETSPLTPLSGQKTEGSAEIQVSDSVSIYFDHGSSTLDADDAQGVHRAASGYVAEGVGSLDVEGHASVRNQSGLSPIERKIRNLEISAHRAGSVARSLVKQGVSADAIRLSAWGETFYDGNEESARRVDITPHN